MRERLFPRWGAALFALLPLSELLYLPVDGQTMYAAALASLVCALLCAGGARIAPFWRRYRILQWALALFAPWPLTQSLARMGPFLRNTGFPARPLWSLILLLTVCTLLTATTGLNRCAMWALPVAWAAGAVLALSKALAQELGPSHIRVNAICPGVIQTDMCANVAPEVLESLREQTPIERLGTPEDIAQATAFLVDAPFITGQVLGVNGGFVIT